VNGFSSEFEELIAVLEEFLDTLNVAAIISGTDKFEFIWSPFRSQIDSNNYRNGIRNVFRS
jgi:hypothetical protein